MDEEGKLDVNVAEIQEQECGKEDESVGEDENNEKFEQACEFLAFSILIFNLAN